MKQKLTDRKLKALIKDEKQASAEYKRLGLPSLARDEARHRRFLLAKKKARRG
jgi:hypothetical protein